jgi:hypothetical protein
LPACEPTRFDTAHYALAGICSPALEGSVATTDAEGIVVFDKLKFTMALPGMMWSGLVLFFEFLLERGAVA